MKGSLTCLVPRKGTGTYAGVFSQAALLLVQLRKQLAAQLPWGHIRTILDKIESPELRDQYAAAAVQHGWTRDVLLNMMMNKTLERSGAAASNFGQQLTTPDSELAQQVAKDPYTFEFLGLTGEVAERDPEQALLGRIVEPLQELGPGFAFVGQQVHLEVGHFWTPSYFAVSAGGAPLSIIKQYIEQQTRPL